MEERLCATGLVSLVMVMNLQRFIRTDDAQKRRSKLLPQSHRTVSGNPQSAVSSSDLFNRLRGSAALASFLKHDLRPNAPFVVDTNEAHVEIQGHELSVFRQYLIDTYFFPTYRLTDSSLAIVDPALLAEPVLATHLRNWTFKLRLTRNGMAVVKIERHLNRVPFADISAMILETQRFLPAKHSATNVGIPTQWQLAMDVVAQFVQACNYRFVIRGIEENDPTATVINLYNPCESGRLPLHDRHIVYLFSEVTLGNTPVGAIDLRDRFGHEVVGLLENSLVLREGAAYYPSYKSDLIKTIFANDMATWEDEICLLTPETTFIWHPFAAGEERIIGGGKRPNTHEIYQDYWKSIVRGIEHIVALKNELQLIERQTTRLLEKVPDITRRATDGSLNKADRQAISDLATGIATLFRSLPQQRDLLVPSSVFRWSAAYRKFERLMHLLGIYTIERHIQTNVEELNAFLSHFNSIQLQYASQRTSFRFALITLLFSLMIIPSCMADLIQVWDERSQIDDRIIDAGTSFATISGMVLTGPWQASALTTGGIVLIGCVVTLLYLLRKRG
jgi:hypothetical protein